MKRKTKKLFVPSIYLYDTVFWKRCQVKIEIIYFFSKKTYIVIFLQWIKLMV